MASRMGFESYGIEIESVLVDYANDLAEKYHAEVEFFVGSFIPDGFELDIEEGDEVFRTSTHTRGRTNTDSTSASCVSSPVPEPC